MNILVLNWRDPKHPLAGGAEISLFEHCKYWLKQGAKVTWFSSGFAGADEQDKIENIKIIRKGSHFTVHLYFFFLWMSGKIEKPDIIIDSFHFIPFFTPLYIKKIKIIALINEVAGRLWFSNMMLPFSIIGYFAEKYFFIFYKKNIFILGSESAKKDLVKVGIKEDKVSIIPHGVTLPKKLPANSKEENPTIIYCSRVTKDKGIEDAIKTYNLLKLKIENLKFWIVGKEEKSGYLNELLGRNKVKKSEVEYFGFVSEDKKFELLKKSWVLIHPSQKEGWGLTIIEAATQETPSVGYNVEGLRDSIQDGKTGLLTKPNPKNLADGVLELLKDNTYVSFGSNAKKWSNNFSWEKSGEQSWNILKK